MPGGATMMTENKNQTAPNEPKFKSSSAQGLADLSYEELPLSLKHIIALPTQKLQELLEELQKYYNSTDDARSKYVHQYKSSFGFIYARFSYQTFNDLVVKKWRRQFAAMNIRQASGDVGKLPGQTKSDNFNKNAEIFAKQPHTSPEPTSYRKQLVPQQPVSPVQSHERKVREHKEQNPTQKVAPINREKAKALQIIDKVDKDNLPPPKSKPDFDPIPAHVQPTGDIWHDKPLPKRMGGDDDESSSEEGLEPSELVPHRVIVAEHTPYSFGILNLAINLHQEWIRVLAPYAWIAAWYMKIKDMLLKKMTAQQIIIMHIKYLGAYFGYQFVQWLCQWLFNSFWFTYRAYLVKKKTKCYIDNQKIESYKEVLDDSRSLVRHNQHQMTDRQNPNFHFYQYKFYRRYSAGGLIPVINSLVVKPINKVLRYVTNQPLAFNYRLPEVTESQITVNNWDFPAVFEKYVDYVDDTPQFSDMVIDDKSFNFRRQGKTEVIHSDLLHRLWNASTFNMMNGVEQLHSRISNVINSSNDFVMYSREAKHSAINGTKNMLSYLIQDRYTRDPNRNFHKGSPEPSNMGTEFSISNVPGDPRFLKSLKLIFVSLIWLEFGDGWRSLNLYKSRLESMLSNSHSHTPTSLTQSARLWVKLNDLMQSSLFFLSQILTGRGVAPYLF